ncbi:MAG: hypothetical protein K9W43_12250 [Candidatus Thorarchaeota archaeon]|nr:hypothetical protein [Candidatus Thorarchaeota archaeon]
MPLFGTTDIIRDIILVLDSAVVIYTSLFAFVLLVQWLRSPIRRWSDSTISWSIFMLGMALNSFFFILSDFIFIEDPLLSLMTKAGYLAMMIALLAFYYAMEAIIPYLPKHAVSVPGLLLVAITIFVPYNVLTIVALVASLIAFFVLCLFLIYAVRSTSGTVRHSMEIIFIAFFIGFLGYVGRSDFAYYTLGANIYILAALFLVTGLGIMGITLLSSPALDELDWYNQIYDLFVIHYSGLLIFHESFKEDSTANEDLTAAGITGVQSLFKEILKSDQGLSSMSVGDKHILFTQGEKFTTVLITKKPYKILLEKVRSFTQQFQLVYSEALEKDHVEAIKYERVYKLVNEIFASEISNM